jgi:hypothetical protein
VTAVRGTWFERIMWRLGLTQRLLRQAAKPSKKWSQETVLGIVASGACFVANWNGEWIAGLAFLMAWTITGAVCEAIRQSPRVVVSNYVSAKEPDGP